MSMTKGKHARRPLAALRHPPGGPPLRDGQPTGGERVSRRRHGLRAGEPPGGERSPGRHALRGGVPGTRGRLSVILILLAVTTIAIGGTGLAALRYDERNARRILPGVTVAGVDVSGMTRREALRAIRAKAELTLGDDLRIRAGDRAWRMTPADLGLRADVSRAVRKALAVNQSLGFVSRVYHRILGSSVDARFGLGFTSQRSSIEAFVDEVARAVHEPATDAAVVLSADGQGVAFRHARRGSQLDVDSAQQDIRMALRRHDNALELPVNDVKPQVPDADLGYTIVISRADNELSLYDGYDVVKTYPVATAARGYETPSGSWTIVGKAENPTWTNPAPNGWGAGAPAQIPPGPGNPLGTRALYLDAPGIRIHGTYDANSVGTYASHGCVRMHIRDSVELYDLVPVGTPVLVI
jgi:lipoprotein-anchoring transpeptidase ErfK/SrfK